MRAITKPGTLAMQTKVGEDHPQQVRTLDEAMLWVTSGESDRTNFIALFVPPLESQGRVHRPMGFYSVAACSQRPSPLLTDGKWLCLWQEKHTMHEFDVHARNSRRRRVGLERGNWVIGG
jgi:hypothetical protein